MLTLGLQHWEAPHPAWASSGPWGGNRRQEALEPPALLYLDIPSRGAQPGRPRPRSTLPWRARARNLKRETCPKGRTRAPSVVSCQVTGTSGPRAAQRPEGLPGSPRPELPSRPRGAGPRMGARGVPGAGARRHSTETAHGCHPTCRLPGGRGHQSHEARAARARAETHTACRLHAHGARAASRPTNKNALFKQSGRNRQNNSLVTHQVCDARLTRVLPWGRVSDAVVPPPGHRGHVWGQLWCHTGVLLA